MEPDDREFMRRLLLRHEKAADAMIARLQRRALFRVLDRLDAGGA